MPDPSGYTWTAFVSGLERPVALTYAPGDSAHLFVIEQPGAIRVIEDGHVLAQPFLDVRDRVGSSGNEQGLLGLAFHPNYAENGYFYVNYTDKGGDTNIARFQVTADPLVADPDSETQLLFVQQPYANHNGGGIAFGPDGYLYFGLGDGGSAGDPQGNAQSLNTYLGKLMRIDVDNGDPYAVPSDNPFVNGGGLPEIWAYGLRNPWRFSFDTATGALYIADVGQNQWEEIDAAPGNPGGLNYGWKYYEATHPYEGSPPADLNPVMPVAEYDHGQGCSVTGGYVYRGSALPAFNGVYLYGDYCSGTVWGLLQAANGEWQNQLLFASGAQIASFGENQDGELYLLDLGGSILKLVSR
jgi:glucose/arabinose dehydrogenase